jgi:hypothetical protein
MGQVFVSIWEVPGEVSGLDGVSDAFVDTPKDPLPLLRFFLADFPEYSSISSTEFSDVTTVRSDYRGIGAVIFRIKGKQYLIIRPDGY